MGLFGGSKKENTREYKFPRHIAIIMDGNGRWAESRGLPRIFGHQAGAASVRRAVESGCEIGLEALTLYAFSWENWDRSQEEITRLMDLLHVFLKKEMPNLHSNQVRLRAIGRIDQLADRALKSLNHAIAETAHYNRMTLTLALSYGGRQEIVDAARTLAQKVKDGTLLPEQIDEQQVTQALYFPDLPDPDLLIRTSGEQRLSNFMLWQSSYSELYVTPVLWPDFSKSDLLDAIAEYERRERRFGRSSPDAVAASQSVTPSETQKHHNVS